MRLRSLALRTIGILLTACSPRPDTAAVQMGSPAGYRYGDAGYPNDVARASPQAIHNAASGTWLWPPTAVQDLPN